MTTCRQKVDLEIRELLIDKAKNYLSVIAATSHLVQVNGNTEMLSKIISYVEHINNIVDKCLSLLDEM
ncbi:MAG: hypothetical protein GX020_09415 [Firmicutes bacterium]|nr:hypothetical protein [Bacillota bacterium]